MNTIDQLVYISRSLLPLADTQDALGDIAHVSRLLNQQRQITGALAHTDGYFIQLLEGAPAALDLLMLHLHFDRRHEAIEIVARERVPQRAIPAWGMIAPPLGQTPSPDLSLLLVTRPSDLAPWRRGLIETVRA